MKVCIICFMKGDMHSGEFDGVKRFLPGVELHVKGKGFCGIKGDRHTFEEHRSGSQEAITLALEKMSSGGYDMLILDEISNALKLELVDLPQVLDIIGGKPPRMHLILTGRDAHPEVIKRAHTVSEIKDIKHAYREGIGPRKGIDY